MTRVSRVLMTGPVAPFADAYQQELLARGYAPLSTVSELRQAARFSRWLESRTSEYADSLRARTLLSSDFSPASA